LARAELGQRALPRGRRTRRADHDRPGNAQRVEAEAGRLEVRRGLVAFAAALATLAFANAAFAANTGSIAVWHTPMVLAGSQSTTIHVTVPQSTDPIAATNIYVPSGYGVNVGQPAGTSIGTVDATAFSRDNSLTLPLSGTVV